MDEEVTLTDFLAQNLMYLETPQYLRKTLFQKSPALRYAGLMNPLDAPHHLRATEWHPYREGCVITRPILDGGGSWVNIGLWSQDCQVDKKLPPGSRVTVKLDQAEFDENLRAYSGKVWSSKAPFREGTFWGYTVRTANSMSEVFSQSPFKSEGKSKPYDLKIADSVNVGKDPELHGDSIDGIDFDAHSGFKHALLVVGGLEGLTGVLDNLNEKMTIT